MDPLLFNILFIDIETASQYKTYEEVPERMQPLWDKKTSYFRKEEETPAMLYPQRAAIYAEFGKIICIGVGGLFLDNNELKLKIKTLKGDNEKELLEEFITILESHRAKNALLLCAHNGKEFDFPYLSRRMLINGIPLPQVLDLRGKKPWEVNHIDTMELWKFGDYKNFTSLDLLAAIFDIPSSKSEINGADVSRVYHEENDLERISRYCAADVSVLARLYLKLTGKPGIEDDNILLT